jgi:hypothetical protein
LQVLLAVGIVAGIVRFAKFLAFPLIQLHRATDGAIKVRMLTPLGRWRTTRFQAEDLVEVGPSVPYGKRQGSRFVSPGRGTDKVGKLLGIWELPLRTSTETVYLLGTRSELEAITLDALRGQEQLP